MKRSKHQFWRKKISGFSLAEILIVLAIIGILIMLVLPNQTGVATKTKSLEAQQELEMVYSLEYAYKLQHSIYSNSLNDIGYIAHQNSLNGGTANYSISIKESSNNNFIAQAKAVIDFDGDGVFNVWEINETGNVTEVEPD